MPLLKGEQHPHHRLTTTDVRAIRTDYVPGLVTLADLAGRYHVSTQTISVILRGKTWRHVHDAIAL